MKNEKIKKIEYLEYEASAYGNDDFHGEKIRITNNYLDKYFDAREPLVKIPDNDLNKFIEKLNELRVLDWRDEYQDSNVLDGGSWGLVIVYNDGNKKLITGVNDYPSTFDELNTSTDSATNLEGRIEYPIYDSFLEAIKALVESCGGAFEQHIDEDPYELLPRF